MTSDFLQIICEPCSVAGTICDSQGSFRSFRPSKAHVPFKERSIARVVFRAEGPELQNKSEERAPKQNQKGRASENTIKSSWSWITFHQSIFRGFFFFWGGGILSIQSWGPFVKRNLARNLVNVGGKFAGNVFGKFWRNCTLANENLGCFFFDFGRNLRSFQAKFAKCAHFAVSQKGSNLEYSFHLGLHQTVLAEFFFVIRQMLISDLTASCK